MVISKDKEIQRLINLIGSNKSVAESHPHLKEKFDGLNEGLENQLEELRKVSVKSKKVIKDSNQENVVKGRCRAMVRSTDKPCCNREASAGYCLIHLKQRNPDIAEDFQRNRLSKRFGLTEEEIDKIKESNGTLENVGKGLASFIKSQRST